MVIRDPYHGERNESGQRHGQGSYEWSSVFSYSGEWCKGVMEGHGVMRVGDSTIEGEFAGGEIDGVGVRTWHDGDGVAVRQYRGEFRKGEMWGSGEMATAKDRYVGDFVANRFEGSGTLTTAAKAVSDVTKAWRKEVPGDRLEGTLEKAAAPPLSTSASVPSSPSSCLALFCPCGAIIASGLQPRRPLSSSKRRAAPLFKTHPSLLC